VNEIAATRKTATDRVLSTLKRGPKRGLTAALIAERADLNLSTARTILWQLVKDGEATVVSKVETGERGRPANLYAAA
jgi:predicted ArsR family transcriptional regulator